MPKGEKLKRGLASQRHTHVIGIKSRDGKVRAKAVSYVAADTAIKFVKQNTGNHTTAIYTDQNPIYNSLKKFAKHASVNHSIKEYVVGDVHTNGIESFWSLLKRGIVGSYHRVSSKHLQRYVDEYCWRQNHAKDADLFYELLAGSVAGEHIKYSELTS